jgi:hypothetical protein
VSMVVSAAMPGSWSWVGLPRIRNSEHRRGVAVAEHPAIR